jgi:hypothetical protein
MKTPAKVAVGCFALIGGLFLVLLIVAIATKSSPPGMIARTQDSAVSHATGVRPAGSAEGLPYAAEDASQSDSWTVGDPHICCPSDVVFEEERTLVDVRQQVAYRVSHRTVDEIVQPSLVKEDDLIEEFTGSRGFHLPPGTHVTVLSIDKGCDLPNHSSCVVVQIGEGNRTGWTAWVDTGQLWRAGNCMGCAFTIPPAPTRNLLVNAGFATDLSSWRVRAPSVTAVWQALDAKMQSTSGSASVTNTAPGLSQGLEQCLPATTGEHYDFGATMEVPPGQGVQARPGHPLRPVEAYVAVFWFSGPNCGGTPSMAYSEGFHPHDTSGGDSEFGVMDLAPSSEVDSHSIDDDSCLCHQVGETGVAPPSTQSARVVLSVKNPSGSSAAATAYFDNAYFRVAAPTKR